MNNLQTIPKPDAFDTIDTRPKNISIEAIAALLKSGMSKTAIAKTLNCSRQNLWERMKDAEDLQDFQTHKDYRFENIQRKLCDSLDPEQFKKESTLQKVTAIGILEDKLRNIRGQATLRIDSFHVTASLEDLSRRKQELMDKVMANIQPVVLDTIPTPSIIPDKQDK